MALYLPGDSTPDCAAFFPYQPRSLGASQQPTLAFDLRSTVAGSVANPAGGNYPDCHNLPIDRELLPGAGIDLEFTAGRQIPIGNTVTLNYYIDGFELRTGWDLEPASAAGGSGWDGNAGNILTSDNQTTGYELSGCPFLGSCATDTRSIQIDGFDSSTNPHVPTDGPLLKAGVIVTGKPPTPTGSPVDRSTTKTANRTSRITPGCE